MAPPIRTQILEAAIRELARNGSEFFRTPELCRRLHIARSLINHHFGSQLGLIAEATAVAYERYVWQLKEAADMQATPTARLEAWMAEQSRWFVANRGIAVQLQMPHQVHVEIMREKFADRLLDSFKFNMAVLAVLVKGVQHNEMLSLDFDVQTAPFDELLSDDVSLLMRVGSVGMSALGASVWSTGTNMPSRDLDVSYLQTASQAQHAKWVVRALTSGS